MNRPLQLDGYLRSLKACLSPCPEVTVLFRAVKHAFLDGYRDLARQHMDVTFLPESRFDAQVLAWAESAAPLMLFGCDDVVFRRKVSLSPALPLICRPDIIGFSLRLGKNIRFSQSDAAEIPRPPFLQRDELLVWDWSAAESHWGYPFELNGTVYRRDLVLGLLRGLESQRHLNAMFEWRHPNLLELRGNELLRMVEAPPLMACFPESALVVPTVNCVQSIFDNPLLGPAMNVDELERARQAGATVDIEACRQRSFDRIHVGELLLEEKEPLHAAR